MMTTQTDTTVEDAKFTWPILTGPTSQQGITEIFANQKEKCFPRQLFNCKTAHSTCCVTCPRTMCYCTEARRSEHHQWRDFSFRRWWQRSAQLKAPGINNTFTMTALLKMVKMVHGPSVQTLSHTSMDLLLHTTAATRVARVYVRRKIQKWQDRSQRCHQLCPIFTAKLDPAADKQDFLCSSDTKVTSWTQLTDFQIFQIFIHIHWKTILNNMPE